MQTSAVILNAIPVVVWVIHWYWLYVAPGLPGNLSIRADALMTAHAVAGLVGVGARALRHDPRQPAHGERRERRPLQELDAGRLVVYLLATVLGVWVYVTLYG